VTAGGGASSSTLSQRDCSSTPAAIRAGERTASDGLLGAQRRGGQPRARSSSAG
jgi:hypothetical protein